MVSRAEHRRKTLLKLGQAAVELFETEGPGATVEAIATRAGVSRRTVFRYVEAKEELAYVHPMLWFDVFDAVVEEHAGRSLDDRLFEGGLALARHIDADPDPPRRAFLVAGSNPSMARGFTAIFQRWVERVAAEATADPADADDRFRARVIGSACMGMIDACTREWLLSNQSFESLFRRGFEQFRPVLAA